MGFGHSNRRMGMEVLVIAGFLATAGAALWGAAVVAADLALKVIPYSVDQQVGGLATNLFAAEEKRCTNPALLEAAEALVAPLREQLPEEQRTITVTVVDDEAVNAFALPGGHLFILTGLLHKAGSTSEVAGILGHEIGHAVLRHSMRAVIRSAGLWTASWILLGGYDRVLDSLTASALDLGGLAFGRSQEADADAFAVDLAARAGVDVSRMPDFFERVENEADVTPPAILSTHPSNADRVAAIRAALVQHPVKEPRVMPALEVLKAPCHAGR